MTITGMMVLIQLFFGVVIGLYFWNLLKSQHTQRRSVDKESQKEMDQLRRMRKIKLTEPLSERVRPKNFADIVGQSHGIRSLQAAICGPNPQHVIIYGPPGVGKTAAARLVLEEAKANPNSPFRFDSVFVELDGATARFDERGIADPLIGSVHDPIYQGAGAMGQAGIPQPKQGAVTKAHGGILFIDEIGELHSIQINKLLKVLEERRVFLESAYYHEENPQIPEHIHDIFKKGLPADFRLIAATTRHPEEIPPAIRSRCVEVFFRGLTQEEVRKVAAKSVDKLGMDVESTVYEQVASYATNGREAVNMIQLAAAMAINEGRQNVRIVDLEWVIHAGQMSPRMEKRISSIDKIGAVNGLAVSGPGAGMLLEVEVTALKRAAGGGLIVTGIADEESTGNQMRSVKRKSMARSSVENVVTVLKHMGIKTDQYDLHVNFPGGVPVDGPSAGIAIATAIYSAIHRIPVSHHIAMTGEIGIYGDVKPVGGVVTKVEAAKHAGVSEVIIPKENNQMVLQEVEGITVFPVENLKEVFDKALKVTEINREEIQDTLLNSFSLLDKEGSIG
ncbi:ATP-dependent protease LonB [Salipaludibacillus agaradhaerens]|uniref:endopeptidase La n=1 Tax=Salipaludibacillus agaradhaerens TaxID=76935 RepID=A0A9Q4AZQ6_SALAG|nr:ATP-dependent protease LonB [Salipaludibacillus agaradhaerens]MCR6095633.1 ATP-dependent protease LonB [Salipaludibacillus agaradhaerens]MCR6114807.1 ATP-dependent protease LonB [Salipaludibacillus agaradhaerens]